MARRKIRKMFVVEEKFVEDEEEVVTGRVGRNRNRTWRSHSRRLLVLTWHLLSFCLSLSAPPPLSPLSFSFSLMSGMLRPRHALIGDGLRRPTTAAYARTQLGKCGGSWVVPEYGFLARCRVVALLQATVIHAVLPPTSTTHHYSWVDTTSTHLSSSLRALVILTLGASLSSNFYFHPLACLLSSLLLGLFPWLTFLYWISLKIGVRRFTTE